MRTTRAKRGNRDRCSHWMIGNVKNLPVTVRDFVCHPQNDFHLDFTPSAANMAAPSGAVDTPGEQLVVLLWLMFTRPLYRPIKSSNMTLNRAVGQWLNAWAYKIGQKPMNAIVAPKWLLHTLPDLNRLLPKEESDRFIGLITYLEAVVLLNHQW